MPVVLIVIAAWVLIGLVVLGLCWAAASGDEDEARRRRSPAEDCPDGASRPGSATAGERRDAPAGVGRARRLTPRAATARRSRSAHR